MKMQVAVRLLRLLNSRPEQALTVREIADKWAAQNWTDQKADGRVLRSFQRYMNELSEDSADGPALVNVVEPPENEARPAARNRDKKPEARKYYLRLSQTAQWFMTEEAALQFALTRQVVARSFGKLDPKDEQSRADMVDALAKGSVKLRRLRERLRIVPDGIGRLPAKIDTETLAAAVEAISLGERLVFSYKSSQGRLSEKNCSPLGLVAKDGTIYLVAKLNRPDVPIHFALHRMTAPRVVHQPAEIPPGFDLDSYIEESHQFSHTLDSTKPPLTVKLRAAPESLWHFSERPLSIDQSITLAGQNGGWHIVTAAIPDTMLLVPFLLSMGPWIEVLEPASLRNEVAKRLAWASAHYASSTSGN